MQSRIAVGTCLAAILTTSLSVVAIDVSPPTATTNPPVIAARSDMDTFLDWAKIIAVGVAATGLFLNAYQTYQATKLRRIEHVSSVLHQIHDDEDMRKIYYQLEYGDFQYDSATFHDSDNERRLDKLLTNLNSLAKLVDTKLIHLADLELISYQYLVVFQDTNVNAYFEFLDDWFKARHINQPRAFHDFRSVGSDLEQHAQ